MFGPVLGPRQYRVLALAMASAAGALSLSPTVQAEDAASEAVIGTFEATKAARAAEGRPATFDFDARVRSSDDRPSPGEGADDDAVSRLFADALDDLEHGKADSAQRKFEGVVARDPEGHLAKSARSYLADLYRATVGEGEKKSATVNKSSSKFATQRSALGAADIARDESQQQRAAGISGVPVSAGVEEEFIVQAGDRVFFGSGSAELGQRARIVLAAQARWLARHGDVIAVIEGHADDGNLPDAQSALLSEQRAAAVRDRLLAEGIPEARLFVAAAGRSQPIADCRSPDCAAQNRRAVTVLKVLTREGGRHRRGPAVASDGAAPPTR